ncbi:MAG: hypothetical protein JNL01_13790 [Bdellovibrionales bacterium]|nr:hypothetical protein [Bdellovibrionales bacterium]
MKLNRIRIQTNSGRKVPGKSAWNTAVFCVLISGSLTGCYDAKKTNRSTTSTTTVASEYELGMKVVFQHESFYSLVEPQSGTSCAGDARTFYKAWNHPASAGGTPPTTTTFPSSSYDVTQTQKPSWIKNVAVDLTDSAAQIPANLSKSCSLGVSSTLPPVSTCATFDYGSVNGIPATLSGAVILFGGQTDVNSVSPSQSCGMVQALGAENFCSSTMHALGIDTLSASTSLTTSGNSNPLTPGLLGTSTQNDSISNWVNLTQLAGSSATVPPQLSSANLAYSSEMGKLILFGGMSTVSSLGAGTATTGSDSADVWTYDLATQAWTRQTPPANLSVEVYNMIDQVPGGYDFYPRTLGARANFGFISVPGLGLQTMTPGDASGGLLAVSGIPAYTNLNTIDTTERIVVVGGNLPSRVSVGSMKFNPTFGPELIDLQDPENAISGVAQYVESFHTQWMSNSNLSSQLGPELITEEWTNIGAAPARRVSATNQIASGQFVVATGFNFNFPNTMASPSASPSPVGLRIGTRTDTPGASPTPTPVAAPRYTIGQMLLHPDTLTGMDQYPLDWRQATEDTVAPVNPNQIIPEVGGASVLPGFNLLANDIVIVGGSTCRDYINDASVQTPVCLFGESGYDDDMNTTTPRLTVDSHRYFRLGSLPLTKSSLPHVAGVPNYQLPANLGMAGTPPKRAGMASARGQDSNGNVINVYWGGMSAATDVGSAPARDQVHVLYNAGTLAVPVPTWLNLDAPNPKPAALTNAAMVFSHTTGKFYLFGGLATTSGLATMDETWELTLSGTCTSSAPVCVPTWRKLSPTCFPNCPGKRRSHKMVEVNYAMKVGLNVDPATHKPDCSDSANPCSFGIFMMGGSPDGFQLLDDRWMFDPTAANGNGHWQRAMAIPARHSSHMATVDLYVPSSDRRYKRALVFGGEMGLQDPFYTVSGEFFVPQTLGDTWIYDLETNQWHRVRLLGQGYTTSVSASSEAELRQSYITDPTNVAAAARFNELSALTPPALAGGVMVTRTFPGATASAATPLEPLKVPEVFLFGGRKKDGSYLPLTSVYKFCMGTGGENDVNAPISSSGTDDASCDHYDATDNPNSPYPTTDYVGRWLLKSPAVTGLSTASQSFQGAGTYDPTRDRIILVGGRSSNAAVTHTTGLETTGFGAGSVQVLEYTPPSRTSTAATAAERNGAWTAIGNCTPTTGSLSVPTGRYGHTLTYDGASNQLVMTGGYDQSGALLASTLDYAIQPGRQYLSPEVWTAKYYPFLVGGYSITVGDQNTAPSTVTFTPPAAGCYVWVKKTVFGNSIDATTTQPPLTGVAHAAAVSLPASGYNTGYYSFFDDRCTNANPVITGDPLLSRENAGGVYFDIDRSKLGASENLLLHLTFIPLGTRNLRPDGARITQKESAVMEVHLVRTGESQSTLINTLQPRYVQYAETQSSYPQVVNRLAVMSPPTGEIRQEQIVIPLTQSPDIDRIRINRQSGSAILIDASLYRMGGSQ